MCNESEMTGDDSSSMSQPEHKSSASDESGSHNRAESTRTPSHDEEVEMKRAMDALNVVSLLAAPSRDECGYCHGSRYSLLSHSNPPKDYEDDLETPLYTIPSMEPNTNGESQSESQNNESNDNDNDNGDDKRSSKSYYFSAQKLSATDYNTLLDRNWRRSGDLLYRPLNYESCCPLLSIRLKADDFQWEKKWKRVASRFDRALWTGTTAASENDNGSCDGPLGSFRLRTSEGRRTRKNRKIEGGHLQREEQKSMTVRHPAPTANETKPLTGRKGEEKQMFAYAKQSLQNSSFISTLKELTRKHFHSTLSSGNFQHDEGHDFINSILERLEKLIKYQVLPGTMTEAHKNENSVVSIKIRTTICAALEGMSKASSAKVELKKEEIGQSLVSMLRSHFQMLDQEPLNPKRFNLGGANGDVVGVEVEIRRIILHQASGQVSIEVLMILPPSYLSSSVSTKKKKIDKKPTSDSKLNTTQNVNSAEQEDAIQTYIKCLHDRYPHLYSHLPIPTPPYNFTVESIPSDVSGRMLTVHRLYTDYEAAIHKNVNPFDDQKKGVNNVNISNTQDKNAAHEEVEIEIVGCEEHDTSHPQDGKDEESEHVALSELSEDMNPLSLDDKDLERLFPDYNMMQRQAIGANYATFYKFLCESPFPKSTIREGDAFRTDNEGFDTQIPYGCYHQHYKINNRYIFAVGVVDVLPTCLSSVYAFYDPSLSESLQLGKLTALREIQWVQRAKLLRPKLEYYYLGFYIHSCQKMKYKAEYRPSEVLCPSRRVWVDFKLAEPRLEKRSPIRHCANISTPGIEEMGDRSFSEERGRAVDTETDMDTHTHIQHKSIDLRHIYLDRGGECIPAIYLNQEGRSVIKDFAQEVGGDIARRCKILC